MYAIHSIAYSKLDSYFYVFAIREKEQWLSWEEVKFYADFFEFPTVPEIKIKTPLKDYFQDHQDKHENKILAQWLTINLGMPWTQSVETEGLLAGYSPENGKSCSEGFVIRNKQEFKTNQGIIKVASNEFNNIFKLVRKSHVKTDVHWTKTWKPSQLIDYNKYNWFNYQFMKYQ
jgi:hypothetical protein